MGVKKQKRNRLTEGGPEKEGTFRNRREVGGDSRFNENLRQSKGNSNSKHKVTRPTKTRRKKRGDPDGKKPKDAKGTNSLA